MKFKNSYTKLTLTIAFLAACSTAAFADGSAFTPLNFDDTYTAPPVSTAPKTTAVAKPANPVSKAVAKVMPSKTTAPTADAINTASGEVPIGNDNIQNAILELDNAQVGIRNDLLNYKAKYADVDAQFKLIKNERTMLSKQVKSIEKRIKDIDKAKDRIRKNML